MALSIINFQATEILDTILGCLEDNDRPPVDDYFISTSSQHALECCNRLVVYLKRIEANSGLGVTTCGSVASAVFGLSLTRCVPTITDHGVLPSPAEINAAAESANDDALIIWNCLTCYVSPVPGCAQKTPINVLMKESGICVEISTDIVKELDNAAYQNYLITNV